MPLAEPLAAEIHFKKEFFRGSLLNLTHLVRPHIGAAPQIEEGRGPMAPCHVVLVECERWPLL